MDLRNEMKMVHIRIVLLFVSYCFVCCLNFPRLRHLRKEAVEELVTSTWYPERYQSKLTIPITLNRHAHILELEACSKISPGTEVNLVDGTKVTETLLFNLGLSFYTGRVKGYPGSYVSGVIQDRYFTGTIEMSNETLFVEHASYIQHGSKDPISAIVYREKDLKLETCDHPLVIDDGPIYKELGFKGDLGVKNVSNRSCPVELVADYEYYKFHKGNIPELVKEMVMAVRLADKIFRDTDFDNDNVADDVGIRIVSITIYTTKTADLFANSEKMSTHEALKLFSRRTQSYCLSIGFFHRVFSFFYLGLAHTAVPGERFGLCDHKKDNPLKISSNTLIIFTWFIEYYSNVKDRLPVIAKALSVITAHEIAHAFGADHDDLKNDKCVPPKSALNLGELYLMAPHYHPSLKFKPNQLKFSECSKEHISAILNIRGYSCLHEDPPAARCGNFVIDEGEECDCGDASVCNMMDPCCNPAGTPKQCQLRDNAECSNKLHPDCCTKSCKIVRIAEQKICKVPINFTYKDEDCQVPSAWSLCDGKSPECIPFYKAAPNWAPCGECGFCYNGECIKSNACY